MEELLTITQVAEKLGIARQNVHKHIKAGRLKAQSVTAPGRHGKVWVISRKDLEAFMGHKRKAGRPKKVKKRKKKS